MIVWNFFINTIFTFFLKWRRSNQTYGSLLNTDAWIERLLRENVNLRLYFCQCACRNIWLLVNALDFPLLFNSMSCLKDESLTCEGEYISVCLVALDRGQIVVNSIYSALTMILCVSLLGVCYSCVVCVLVCLCVTLTASYGDRCCHSSIALNGGRKPTHALPYSCCSLNRYCACVRVDSNGLPNKF